MSTASIIISLIILLCIILSLIVLAQNPKGGGLSSTFGGSAGSQMFGVRQTNNFLEQSTWVLAICISALSLMVNIMTKPVSNQPPSEETIQQEVPQAETSTGDSTQIAP